MQRYFVTTGQWVDGTVTILDDDAHHLVHVIRAKAGDEVIVSDGAGREARVVLMQLDKQRVVAQVAEQLEAAAEPAVDVWIAQSLPKGDKMEMVIQKGTEIGAARFVPFLSQRTIVQYDAKKEKKQLERWSKIAKEAAEQAHRNRIPPIDAPASWKQLLALAPTVDLALLCYEKEQGESLAPLLRRKLAVHKEHAAGKRPSVLLAIGPEGGFAEQEVAVAEAAGFVSVGLGKRILRAETAGLVGLTCILYETGEMGG